MSDETQPTAPAPDAGIPEGIDQVDDFESRVAMFKDASGPTAIVPGGEYSSEEEAERPQPAPAPVAAAKPEPEPPPAPPAPTGPTRAEKFAALRAAEASKYQQSRQTRDAETRLAEIERLHQSVSEREKRLEPFIRAYENKDLMALSELMQDKFAPDELAAAPAQWTSDEAREKYRMKTAKQEAVSEMRAEISRLEKMLEDAVIKPQREQQERHQVDAAYKHFAETVKKHAEDAPYSSKLLERNPNALFALADATANMLIATRGRGNFNGYDVIDEIERNYSEPTPQQPAPSTGQSTKQDAAGKATTVTNRHAAERTTVTESDDAPEGESFDDRVRRLQRDYSGAQLQPRRG